jgi:hypothetical protein
MSTSNAENSAFISNNSSTEFGNVKVVLKYNLLGQHLVNIKEMDMFASPFKVMYELTGTVTFFQNKGVVKEFTEFLNHINIRIVSNPA